MEKALKVLKMDEYYLKIRELGKGGQGTIFLARSLVEKKYVALKVINPFILAGIKPSIQNDIRKSLIKNQNLEKYATEVQNLGKILKKLHLESELLQKISSSPNCDKNIVCFYDDFLDFDTYYYVIVMQYIDGISLYEYKIETDEMQRQFLNKMNTGLNKEKYKLVDWSDIGMILLKILVPTLKHMHENGVLHLDIKPENIMVDQEGNQIIVDLGLSCNILPRFSNICQIFDNFSSPCCKTKGFTIYYTPPEVFTQSVEFPSSDLWSLAATIYMIVTGKNVWNLSNNVTVQQARKLIPKLKPAKLNSSNQKLNFIINKMLSINIVERPTSHQIINFIYN